MTWLLSLLLLLLLQSLQKIRIARLSLQKMAHQHRQPMLDGPHHGSPLLPCCPLRHCGAQPRAAQQEPALLLLLLHQ